MKSRRGFPKRASGGTLVARRDNKQNSPTAIDYNKSMNIMSRRRGFAFSLRTLFVLTAIFAVWLGWQMKFVRDRQAMLTALDEKYKRSPNWIDNEVNRLPLIRRLLGDRSILFIFYQTEHRELDLADVEAMFPEAGVFDFNVAWGEPINFPEPNIFCGPMSQPDPPSIQGSDGDLIHE